MRFFLPVLLSIIQAVFSAPISSSYQVLPFKITHGSIFADSNTEKPVVIRASALDGSVFSSITNEQSFYSVEIEFGSQSEKVTVLIDTGSSDLWVSGANNPFCESGTAKVKPDSVPEDKGRTLASKGASAEQEPTEVSSTDKFNCSIYGTFDETKSTTWHSNETEFYIQYGDLSFASGTWGSDNVNINGIKISDFSFAVADTTNSSVAVLGIGLEELESSQQSVGNSKPFTYANLPTRLYQEGLTQSRSYSLQLTAGSIGDESGSILFGAVDHDKYSGSLQYVPMVNIYADYGYTNPIEFDVTLTSIKTGDTVISDTLYPALLDSGTTLLYAPSKVVDSFGKALGGTYDKSLGLYSVSCSAGSNVSITFNFQGIEIKVPATEFILSISGTNSQCVVGILPSSEDHFIMGDTFLRSAYVVYDLDNYQIALAQSKISSSEDIEVIKSSIPGATKAPLYDTKFTGSA